MFKLKSIYQTKLLSLSIYIIYINFLKKVLLVNEKNGQGRQWGWWGVVVMWMVGGGGDWSGVAWRWMFKRNGR